MVCQIISEDFDQKSLDRILIVFLPGIGNSILLTPMLQAIRDTYPKTTIDLLIREKVVENLLGGSDLVDNFILYEGGGSLFSETKNRVKLLRKLWDFDYDVIFATGWDGLNKESILVGLVPATHKIGYRQDLFHNIIFDKTIEYDPNDHEITRRLLLARAINARGSPDPSLPVNDEAIEFADEIFDELSGEFVVGIHPGSSDFLKHKRWPPDRFATVADTLYQEYNCDILVFGGENEIELAQDFVESIEYADPVVLTGETSITEAIATIGQCDLFISNDSGLMHVAAERGVPVVAIFGPTSIDKNAPVGNNHTLVKRGETIESVATEHVLNAVHKSIKKQVND